MKPSIEKILKKKGKLTGEDVGRAMLYQMTREFLNLQQALNDNTLDELTSTREETEAIMSKNNFTNADLGNMLASIDNQSDYSKYNEYVNISNFVKIEVGFCNTYLMQAQGGISRLLSFVREALHSERVIDGYMHQPVVMTQSKYEALKEKARAKKDASELNFFDVYGAIANNYVNLYYKDDKADNPLKEILADYEGRTFKSADYIARYKERYERYCGHYEISECVADAKSYSSEDLEPEEWAEVVHSIIEKMRTDDGLENELMNYNIENDVEDLLYFQKIENKESPFYEYLVWFDDDEIKEVSEQGLWQILHCYDLFEYEQLSLKDYKKEYKAFKSNCKELDAAILNIMFSLFPDAEKIAKAEKYTTTVCTWGYLRENNLLPNEIDDATEMDIAQEIEDYSTRFRAEWQGIGILPDNSIAINNDGEYTEYNIIDKSALLTVNSYCEDEEIVEAIKNALEEHTINAMKHLYATLELLKVTAEYTKVPELECFYSSNSADYCENNIDTYNLLSQVLRKRILDNKGYKGFEYAQKECSAAGELFPLINIDALKPTEENISEVRELIKTDKEAFTNHSVLLEQKMYRKDDGEGVYINE